MFAFKRWSTGLVAAIMLGGVGCDKADVEKAVADAEAKSQQAAETAAGEFNEAVQAGEQAAKELGDEAKQLGEQAAGKARELGEQAMSYLGPLKEQFGSLEDLKDKPQELKQAVTKLIQSLEEKAADMKLPESVSTALANAKEKLVQLKDYLEGEAEPAKIEEHIQEITSAVKGAFGMSTE
jgi:DNA repair exonuclease SbcCD ATPase subunit